MFHTVISKTGWTTAMWEVQLSSNKASAEVHAKQIKQPDPKQPHYNVEIKRHHKELVQLLNDADMVQFNDGTVALCNEII